tara:strand:+ start:851 stop:1039 length:189 start_codon:yes stop_codon:yes gene_type:complete
MQKIREPKDYDDIEDLIKDHSIDCYETEDEQCGNCGSDLWSIYYLFGRIKCDGCLKDSDFIA